MISRIRNIVLLTTLIIVAIAAQEKSIPNTAHAAAATQWKFFDGNTIVSTIADDGPFNDYRKTNFNGLNWPKGTNKTAIFTSGLILVGRHTSSGDLRVAAQYYDSEFQRGPINGTFNTTTNDISVRANSSDSTFRLYKVTKGDHSSSNPDVSGWPGGLGAPYNDLNANGQWDAGIDTPKMYGDQMLWGLVNDLDTARRRVVSATAPMGMEIRTLYYGFDRTAPLGNTMFVKWRITNRSDATYDSMFVGLFSDVDLGNANDDLDGYDTTLALAYTYNGDNSDEGSTGYGSTPPAIGTLFLGGKPSVTPYAYPMWIKVIIGGDLPMGNPAFAQGAFNYSRGLNQQTGQEYINPLTNTAARFVFTGDPVSNTGWTRAASGIAPNDARSFVSLGPITLVPGTTQEIDAAIIIAQSGDRLQSLSLLRDYAQTIKSLVTNDPNFATSVGRHDLLQPSEFSLDQNYPNPFNPSTTIRFSLPEQRHVVIVITDILGRSVAELTNTRYPAGTFDVQWNGTDHNGLSVASGIYFYHITAGNFNTVKKMILIK